ncbi:unnamed protein product [Notodromas monacha]|uniref:CTCK domain-containing protein n=1 Tax=Notodromas monacha TaxID=399045 RepID=A0A7R9BWN0_9CRUS|nr:unnamed protein product [Notodromas monacha]CAG0921970.1 unnamed protein product [Notodromas monacha]
MQLSVVPKSVLWLQVHNIVLFPEKHAWCNLTRIRQIVSHPGCESVEIDNSVCVGACFSYTVPQTSPPTPGDDLLHYCDSCQQADFEWRVVALECKEGKSPMLKHVQIINNCTCAKCQETPSASLHRKLSNEVDTPDSSHTPEFIPSVRRKKVPDGMASKTGPDLHLALGLGVHHDDTAVEHVSNSAAASATSQLMATTTNVPTSPAMSNRVLLPPPPLLDNGPDLISNAVDAVPGHHDNNAVPDDDDRKLH